MRAASRSPEASNRRFREFPRASVAKALLPAFCHGRLMLLAILGFLGVWAAALAAPAAAQSSDRGIVADGEAAVSGFSGVTTIAPPPQGVDPLAVTFIDLAGPSARVIELRDTQGPPRAQVIPAPKPFTATAAQVGQVFAVAFDRATPPNIYLAASSAYGLPIVLPPVDANAPAQRLTDGAPGAAFMSGLFGPPTMQGGPGSIWRIDGASGRISLFANVTLDGAPNPGPALGGLAFDPSSNSLFVADRSTGIIHRVGLNGVEIGRYDHGVDGRKAAGMPPVAFDPAGRLDITSPNFKTQDPTTWGYAPPERRVFGLAAHGGRLYYAIADGSRIWSVSLQANGAFGADARVELQVPPGPAASEISKIIFDDRGRMILGERGAPTGGFDYQTLAQPSTNRALRYRLLQAEGGAPATWQADPDEYAIGFDADLRNVDGGVAIGYGYRPDGAFDAGSCGGFLWTTGEQLRAAADAALAAELTAMGPLPLNGLQGNFLDAVRPDNVPPLVTYFANYFDDSGNPTFHGHLGDIAIPRGCARAAFALPTPVTPIADWPGVSACPPDFVDFNGICQAPRCPAGHGQRVQCCPRGTWPGANGECEPLRGGNWGCPIGAEPLRGRDGGVHCVWLARCPDGSQADQRGGCQRYCPPGETGWWSRNCCGFGEVGLPDGQCCPERDVHDGRCVKACPRDDIRLPDGECCPPQDVHDGKCLRVCPRDEIRLPDGECCPPKDVHDGKCLRVCPRDEIRLPDGQCCPRDQVHDGKCGNVCPRDDIRLPDGQCCPRQDVEDGKCVRGCGPGFHSEGGRCVINCPEGQSPGPDNACHRTGGNGPQCPPHMISIDGECVERVLPRTCGPGQIRLENGLCVLFRPQPHPEFPPRPRLEYHPPWRRGPLDRPLLYRPHIPVDRGPRPEPRRDFEHGHRTGVF